MLEPKRHFERRAIHKGGTLDRRVMPETTVEGQLQKSHRFIRKMNLISRFVENKVEKVKEEYKKRGRNLSLEEEEFIRNKFYDALERINNRTLANARDLAERDEVTKLLIEKKFKSLVEMYIQENTHGTFFFIDVNNLKKVNDNPKLGHAIGDLYLKTMADTLKEVAQKYNFTVARIGGDEFAMYSTTPNLNPKKMDELIEYARRLFKENWAKKNISGINAEFAIGSANKSEFDHITNPSEMYAALRTLADNRMYENKRAMKATRI